MSYTKNKSSSTELNTPTNKKSKHVNVTPLKKNEVKIVIRTLFYYHQIGEEPKEK